MDRFELGFPGPLRDRLVTAVLDGTKTTTTSLLAEYYHEPLPVLGERSVLVDSDEREVAVVELMGLTTMRLADVDLQHAVDEGEGDRSVQQWRAGHEQFWHSPEIRAELGDPTFTVDDDTMVVLERFAVVRLLGRVRGGQGDVLPPRAAKADRVVADTVKAAMVDIDDHRDTVQP